MLVYVCCLLSFGSTLKLCQHHCHHHRIASVQPNIDNRLPLVKLVHFNNAWKIVNRLIYTRMYIYIIIYKYIVLSASDELDMLLSPQPYVANMVGHLIYLHPHTLSYEEEVFVDIINMYKHIYIYPYTRIPVTHQFDCYVCPATLTHMHMYISYIHTYLYKYVIQNDGWVWTFNAHRICDWLLLLLLSLRESNTHTLPLSIRNKLMCMRTKKKIACLMCILVRMADVRISCTWTTNVHGDFSTHYIYNNNGNNSDANNECIDDLRSTNIESDAWRVAWTLIKLSSWTLQPHAHAWWILILLKFNNICRWKIDPIWKIAYQICTFRQNYIETQIGDGNELEILRIWMIPTNILGNTFSICKTTERE